MRTKLTIVGLVVFATITVGNPPSAEAKVPKLTGPDAKYYVKQAIKRHPKRFGHWQYASWRKINDCKRVSRVRMRCRAQWGAGDVGFKGRVTIWYWRDKRGTVWWDYAYRIKKTDYYCIYGKDKPKGECTKTYVVK